MKRGYEVDFGMNVQDSIGKLVGLSDLKRPRIGTSVDIVSL